MPQRWPQSEEALAEVVVSYLEEQGYDVYPEVQLHAYECRADIVGVRDKIV